MSTTIHVVGGTTFDLLAVGLSALPRNDAGVDEFTESSLAHLPQPFVPTVGGNGGNIAFTASRLGAKVVLVTPLGDDLFAQWLRGELAGAGVEVREVSPDETSVNVVATDQAGRRLSLFRPVTPSTEKLLEVARHHWMAPGDMLVMAGYPHPAPTALRAWAEAASEAGARVALDIGPPTAHLRRDQLRGVLPFVDLLLANEVELGGLVDAGEPQLREITEQLVADFGLAVVVKRGGRGAVHVDASEVLEVPAFEVAPGSTVGAGDAFDAGLVHAVTQDLPARRAVAFGAATAALVLDRGRGVLGAPVAAEVHQFLASNPEPDEGASHG